jgi:hypothetical protein
MRRVLLVLVLGGVAGPALAQPGDAGVPPSPWTITDNSPWHPPPPQPDSPVEDDACSAILEACASSDTSGCEASDDYGDDDQSCSGGGEDEGGDACSQPSSDQGEACSAPSGGEDAQSCQLARHGRRRPVNGSTTAVLLLPLGYLLLQRRR